MDAIPVVDFGEYKLREDEDDDVPGERLQELREEVRRAFTEVGFVYLRNTGIEQDEVRAPHVLPSSLGSLEKSPTRLLKKYKEFSVAGHSGHIQSPETGARSLITDGSVDSQEELLQLHQLTTASD
ncbi:hypothetical protein MHYP_G00263630 [Metynnis hypsauchen]